MTARWERSWLLAFCALLLIAAPLGAANRLRQASLVAPDAEGARLVLQLTAAPGKPKIFTMTGPHRLVIDLPRTSVGDGLKLPQPAGPVRKMRDGLQADGTLRLVLELAKPMKWQSRVEGQQLVIELGRAPAANAPATTLAGTTSTKAPDPAAPPKPVRAAHAPADAGRDVIVAIDPGHGGQDPGALGKGGTREKDVVLAISKALAKRIDAEPGMRAYLTRSDDRFIKLGERAALARKAGADIFISIHADAIHKTDVTGSSVYVLSTAAASSEQARWLAERENAADLKGGAAFNDVDDELASVLMDVSQTARIGMSGEAAAQVLAQLDRVGTVRKSRVEPAPFAVLKTRDIPSMLVETAFISNPGEEKRLRTPEHQQAIANAIFNGVREYFRQRPPDGTLFARQRDQQRALVAARETP